MNEAFIPMPLAVILLLILLLLSAFFSGSETALTRARKTRLRILKNEGNEGAHHAETLLQTPETLLTAILLGNNLVNFAASSITSVIFLLAFGEAGIVYATLFMTIVVVVFSEVLPKTIAVAYAEPIACKIARPLQWIIRILNPIIILVLGFIGIIKKLLKIAPHQEKSFTHQELATMVGLSAETGGLDSAREQMLANSLRLHEVPVKSLMTHRKNMVMLDAMQSVTLAKQESLQKPHSRYPVYQHDQDDILGVLHIRDLISMDDSDQPLGQMLQSQRPSYVPANRNALSQLFDFQKSRQHMAIVVDEFGDLEGLITLEDILEDIVGEIVDEHDAPENSETWKQADGSIIVSGTANLHDLNQLLGSDMPEDKATTIGGLIVHTLGFQPEFKLSIPMDDLRVEILQIQHERITRVRIHEAAPE
ncbi:MAG: hypothetical protein CO186_05515 [Zetaproteobacteria bacterium CG_4_9_14_3_um_filter_49_83]|nr:MAG: hypothetical protein AUJ56_01145 [Zetaproteobacteria bacterium CG1_02_49_23]PIQ33844.1 MAG: hypothetical protein COW62_04190 [Zetaproteobacteria bacterium CG17_big_fil_post_rev_8_21_14_2_50_50_13]PIV29500.1 MAG: hypothetical protein COS35_11690 [Zetaproteobacteria bacterium CG02_land_8_20_14_3_00_50_9]PIY55563.1 MAG: hypothetical protein COZ00_08585 [Zetaproteobacteria bacterium CG_4_10_14_0_8_um_filter_49_80]PJA35456.1 MAG: hypothetical protein CO186_05515 [Zetaproteobacteria bacterium